jgi:hypothetical protein
VIDLYVRESLDRKVANWRRFGLRHFCVVGAELDADAVALELVGDEGCGAGANGPKFARMTWCFQWQLLHADGPVSSGVAESRPRHPKTRSTLNYTRGFLAVPVVINGQSAYRLSWIQVPQMLSFRPNGFTLLRTGRETSSAKAHMSLQTEVPCAALASTSASTL